MVTKRIIPCLEVKDGMIQNEENGGASAKMSPVSLAEYYSENGADELIFRDVKASAEEKMLFKETLRETAKHVFIPMTVGGGIRTMEDFERVLSCGADKVGVNTGAIKSPTLIREAAQRYGDQCVVITVEVKKVNGKYHVFSRGGKTDTEMEPIEWVKRCVGEGAGEVLIHSMDAEREGNGFDISLLRSVCEAVNVPVIASGGGRKQEHFCELFREVPQIDAGVARSIFYFGGVSIYDIKCALHAEGISVRL